ncbi:MAG: cytochrome c4 [Burkholderiaceae bacterium]|nr:cytochrome c4 [Rhodoferax sp.]MCP5284654.1 cytochrome c4 [Burkholderiaceae bacterium]
MIKTLSTTVLALTLGAGTTLAHAQAGNADAGEKKAAQCIGCHGIPGYQMSFPEVHKVPMIAGQNAAFIVSALTAYKKGDRKHPTMRGVAGSLSEQDMADLGAFYERQGSQAAMKTVAAREPSAEVTALLTKGGCASCHGADFNKPIDPSYPKIAGQHADYLYVALKAYQTEGNPMVGRNNAIMGGIAKQFTHAELKALAGYLGGQPGSLATVPQSRWR